MRSLFIAGLTIGLIGSGASAQTYTTDESSDTSTNVITSDDGSGGASTTSTVTVPAAPIGGTSQASLEEAVKPLKPRRIKGELFNSTTVGVRAANTGTGTVGNSAYLGVKYVLNDQLAVSLRPTFTFDVPRANEEMKFKMGDPYLNLAAAKIATFAGDGTVDFIGRAYAPVGENSRNLTKQNGRALGWMIVTKPLTKDLTANWHLIGDQVINSQNGYLAADGSMKANKDFAASQWGEVTWGFAKDFALIQTLGTDHSWTKAIPGQGVTRTQALSVSTYVGFTKFEKLAFYGGVSNSIDYEEPTKDFALYRDDQTEYFLWTSASF